ncbi:MAG TPA: GDSL-type esterase/lipase family protein [Ktedonobacterales bacterium]
MPGRRAHTSLILIFTLLSLIAALAAGCGGTASNGGATSARPTATRALPPVRYVALGASDAVGVGASDQNHTAYVPILISRLPKGASALNLGISGETLHEALTAELPQAIAAQPTLVTVWLVGNDFKNCAPLAQYINDLNTLLTQLKTKTSALVFVANAPDFSALPAIQQQAAAGAFCNVSGSRAAIRALTVQWNIAIARAVAAHHDSLIDLFSANIAANPQDISSDGFHPSDAGYLALANAFWTAITARKAA